MRLSIAIVNWNTTGLLIDCLTSITQHPPRNQYEVIVVDNASADFDENTIRAQFPDAKLIVNSDNRGYAEGNNQAIEASSGDYVLLLNPDTQVTENALEALVRFMENHKDAAAAGGKLVRPDGAIDQSVPAIPYPGAIACEFSGLSRIFPMSKTLGAYRMRGFTYDSVTEVDQPMGACLILSRQAIDEIGLLDTQFPIFFNEVDWLYRAKQKGYKVYFVPNAEVIHVGAASTKQVRRRKMVRESHDSLLRFYSKHFKGKLPAPVYYFTVACIKASRLLRG